MAGRYRCLIVDDEPPARDILRHYLEGHPDVLVAGECANGFEALKAIQENLPDLLFLDIRMPRINGFELLEVLDPRPAVIFCTAYDEHAIRAFEMHAVDYLLKPFSRERLMEAVARAVARLGSGKTPTKEQYRELGLQATQPGTIAERVIVKSGTRLTVIPVESIRYLEAQDDYVMIVSDMGNHLKEMPLKHFESVLPPGTFVRIHRSCIVNVLQIQTVSLYGKESYIVKLRSGEEIRASASGYKLLKMLL